MRKAGLIVGTILILGVLIWWGWFLSTKSLGDADSWSSVLSGFVGVLGLALAVWGGRGSSGVRRLRVRDVSQNVRISQGDRGPAAGVAPSRSLRIFRARDVGEGSVIDQGDDRRSHP